MANFQITEEINNIHRPGKPQKTAKVDDFRILYIKKKNLSQQFKNFLENVGIPLLKYTFKSHPNTCKYGVYNKVKTTGDTQEQESQIRFCQNSFRKASHVMVSDFLDRLNQDELVSE